MTASAPTAPAEVIGIANHQLEKAARCYRLSRRTQILTLILGLSSIFLENVLAYIPALLALVSQTYSWFIRNRAENYHGIGEEGRTYGLLMDGLGWTGERVELTNWFGRVGQRGDEPTPAPVPPDYFASQSAAGLRRLCDHLQENAFWGKHTYKETATLYGRFLWTFVAVAVGFVLVSIPATPGGQGLILARVLVAILASGAAYAQLGEVMAWRSAEAKSDALDRRLEILAPLTEKELRSNHVGTVFSVYGHYCTATAAAPPIPHFIYSRERDRINRLWEVRSV